jgi:hypothetical protein
MTGSRPDYHFEEAASRKELDAKAPELTGAGWKPVGEPRQFELNFPSGRQELRFSQAYTRPVLFPAWERIRSSLPPVLTVLSNPLKRCEHLVHFYEDESVFLSSLESFVLRGLMDGEAVVAITLPSHRTFLEFRLASHGLNLAKLAGDQHLVMLDAHETLRTFMWDGMPSESLFEEALGQLIARLRTGRRTVRAFGEMVGILCEQGNQAATRRLEEIWHRFCQREGLVLYCAYRNAVIAAEPGLRQQLGALYSRVIEA